MSVRREMREHARDAIAFVDEIEGMSRLDDVTGAMEQSLAPFGIDSFIVTGLPTKWQPFEELVMASRWPAEFFMLYIENDYARFDPLCRRSIQSRMPFEWDADSYRTDPDPRVVEMMQRAAEFGLRRGMLVPIHGPNGEEGCVSTAAAKLDLSARAKASIHLISLYAFERMRRLRGPLPEKRALLTAREREVLTWAAHGKSAAQISNALSISKRTVDEHTQTAARKLGAANRTQAVAIALRDRIIDL
jgi:LuxR family transcriptional regulator, quorum-sensing system regulator BjaR1